MLSRLAIVAASLSAAAVSCDQSGPQPPGTSDAQRTAATAPGKAAAAPPTRAEAAFKPWRKEANCYWVMTYPDGVAHRATMAGGYGTGVNLTLVDSDLFYPWPIDERIPVSLRFDGDAANTVETLASHGDDDASSVLAVVLDKPARELIPGSSRLELLRDGKSVLELPMAGNPTADELEACDI